MTSEIYVLIIKVFMTIMPIELIFVATFAWACIDNKDTHQPAFWYALLCIGVLVPEIIRGAFILSGDMEPVHKQVALWILELIPFGGFLYELKKRYASKFWANFRSD